MKNAKCVAVLSVSLLVIFYLASCNDPDTDTIQARKTKEMMRELNNQVGFPNISNFQEKKLMKMIYELRDREDLICYAYLFSEMTGKLTYIGKCIGFGIPFSAQYTNPMRRIGLTEIIIPQPDPNGLFMPTSSEATYLIMINPETNEPQPVYFEPRIVVSPFPLPGTVVED